MTNLRSSGSGLPLTATACLFATALMACAGRVGPPAGEDAGEEDDVVPDDPFEPGEEGAPPVPPASFAPPPATLRRLTQEEFANAVEDLLGVPLPSDGQLQPDSVVARYASLGAASTGLSETGVEKAEVVLRTLTQSVLGDGSKGMRFVGCDAAQADCVQRFVEGFGRRAFRRPLTDTERGRYVTLAKETGALLGNPWQGLAMATAGMLQSPNFLYRAELGEASPEAEGLVRFSAWDLASRLSFLLWATTPDEELLDAASKGELADSARWRNQVERLLRSPRAKTAAGKFFRELMGVDGNVLQKSPEVFPNATPILWSAMRTEVERLMIDAAFGDKPDIREAFRGNKAYVTPELANLYGLTSPGSGVQLAEHAQNGPRVGVLTSAGFLAQHGIPERGSPVLRGLFVRETLLCAHIPDPPENVDLTLNAPEDAKTTRQKLEQHATVPACSACHKAMDELGFAFENFDGIGTHRLMENGVPVDTSGSLDGKHYADAKSLVALLLGHEDFDRCLVTQLYRYANGRMENDGDAGVIASLAASLRSGGYDWSRLLLALTGSPGFRFAGNPL